MVPTAEKLSARDASLIWHPLTQHKLNPEMKAIVRAEGTLLYDEDGKSYIDAIASWYCSMYGHCNPLITEKVKAQLDCLTHVVFSGFTHGPAVELSEILLELLPENQDRIFYSDNGSTATEVGIKMALQFHYNRGVRKPGFLAFEGGFHGDTFGAMSVSGLDVYNAPFKDFSLDVKRIPVPDNDNISEVLNTCEKIVAEGEIAGFIYEPLVQGAAAMRMYAPEHLDQILALLKSHGVLTIADEVMTGFGKTGTIFASDQVSAKPDIICLSKALTAGIVPMGATSCTREVYNEFYSDDLSKGFFHGHTYTANPVACTAALAGIALLQSTEIQESIQRISEANAAFRAELDGMKGVLSARNKGVILAIDLDVPTARYGQFRDRLYRHFMDAGIFLRPLGNTVYILPPYVISPQELQEVYGTIRKAVNLFAQH